MSTVLGILMGMWDGGEEREQEDKVLKTASSGEAVSLKKVQASLDERNLIPKLT